MKRDVDFASYRIYGDTARACPPGRSGHQALTGNSETTIRCYVTINPVAHMDHVPVGPCRLRRRKSTSKNGGEDDHS